MSKRRDLNYFRFLTDWYRAVFIPKSPLHSIASTDCLYTSREGIFLSPLIAAISAIIVVQPVAAVEYTWAAGQNDWNTIANWTPNGIPGAGDRAIIGSGAVILSSDTGVTGFDLVGGVFGADLAGAGNLTVSELMTFTGGRIGTGGGNVISNGDLIISGGEGKNLGRGSAVVAGGIINNGSAIWTGAGGFSNGTAAKFTNSPGANFDIRTDADFSFGTFNNQGALIKSVGATDGTDKTTFRAVFDNSGSVNVQQGTLSLIISGTHTGSFTTGSNAWIEFAGDGTGINQNLNAGSSITGNIRITRDAGETIVNTNSTYDATRTEIAGGDLHLIASTKTDMFSISNGSLYGTGNVTASGLAKVTGGNIGGSNGGTLIANGGLEISGSDEKRLIQGAGPNDASVINNGHASWTGGGSFDNLNGTLINSSGANFDIRTDADFSFGTFNNQGTLIKSVGATDGTDKTTFRALLDNSGTLNIQQGTLEILRAAFNNHGLINVAAGGVLYGNTANFANSGTIEGNGTIQTEDRGRLLNAGSINPGDSIGHLTLNGTLHQTETGVLNFDLASLNNFDHLTITQNVLFGGDLSIWSSGYTPITGETFVIATFNERLDDSSFSSIHTHGFGSDVKFNVIYNEHNLTLAVSPVPEPENWVMLLAGLGLIGSVICRSSVS